MPFITTALAVGGIAATTAGGILSYKGQQGIADASKSAAQLQAEQAQKSLDFQKQQYSDTVAREAPWVKAGQTAVGDLSSLLAPGGELSKGWSGNFTAPTAAQAEATPGYQFTLDQGRKAIENSAAATGSLLSGGTLTALDKYSQGLASGTYQQAFNNAFTAYGQKYNEFQQTQANKYNRLASLAGLGQTSAGQVSASGTNAARNVTDINLNTGAQIGQDYLNASSARASGYNAIGNSFGSGVNSLQQMYMLNNLLSPKNPVDLSGVSMGDPSLAPYNPTP